MRPSQLVRRERLAALIGRVAPQLVHANSLSMTRLSGPVVEATRTASMGHLRDIVRVSRRAMDDINRHRRILVVSQAARDFHLARGLSAEKSYVQYNGVDLQMFHPRPRTGALHEELSLPRAAPLVGFIGQLGMRKGVDVLLDAARRLSQQLPDFHLVLVGTRHSTKVEAVDFERRLYESASSAMLAGRVHFLGEREDVPQILNELTLLVHPARQEPLGRVLLEAAATGLPVVATRVGGTEEIFPAAGMARLTSCDEADALAGAMCELLSDSAWRDSLGRAARKQAEAVFDVHGVCRQLLAHYRAALDGNPSLQSA
jgi:glycosyltransferase involved in cell wall biosynthesis